MLGLAGRDLAAFGYEGAWEGASVSGLAVRRSLGHPIEKARKRVERWTAVVAFTEWLCAERPQLFAELEEKLW
jgi:hypothetical protein